VIVAPDGELSLGMTNEKQSAHGPRLRKRSGIGKVLSSTGERDFREPLRRPLLALSLVSFLQVLVKRSLGVRWDVGGHELVNRPGL
jgi:hypothetical protein